MVLEIIGYTLLIIGGFIVIMDPSCHNGHNHHNHHSHHSHNSYHGHHGHRGHYI